MRSHVVAIENDRNEARQRHNNHRAYTSFLNHWGVEVATDLTASQNSTANPSGLWAPVSPMSAIFTLGGSISGGATSSNENIGYNVFYPIAALYKPKAFPCEQRNPSVPGSAG